MVVFVSIPPSAALLPTSLLVCESSLNNFCFPIKPLHDNTQTDFFVSPQTFEALKPCQLGKKKPVEFLVDRQLVFLEESQTEPYEVSPLKIFIRLMVRVMAISLRPPFVWCGVFIVLWWWTSVSSRDAAPCLINPFKQKLRNNGFYCAWRVRINVSLNVLDEKKLFLCPLYIQYGRSIDWFTLMDVNWTLPSGSTCVGSTHAPLMHMHLMHYNTPSPIIKHEIN